MMIRTDWLHSFEAFARWRSFTRAARELAISQPALHTQIKQLQEDLGVALYQRRGRELVLTPAGEQLATHARDLARAHAGLRSELRGEVPLQRVTVAAGEGTLLYLLGPVVQAFRRESSAPLTVLSRDRAGCVEAVASGLADVGVSTGPVDLDDDWEMADVRTSHPVVAMSADHPLVLRERLAPSDLARSRLVVPPAGSPLRVRLDVLLQGIPWTAAVETRGWPLTLHFVSLGLGVAVVNDVVALPPGVVARPLDGLDPVVYQAFRRVQSGSGPAFDFWNRLTRDASW